MLKGAKQKLWNIPSTSTEKGGISNIDILNMYKKYMVVNGYSEMWLNNPYSEA